MSGSRTIPVRRSRGFGPAALSAFFYPGAGQFLQRRFIAGTTLALSFTAFLIGFLLSAGRIIYRYYTLMQSDDNLHLGLPLIGMAVFFPGAIATWAVGIADALASAGRRNRPTDDKLEQEPRS